MLFALSVNVSQSKGDAAALRVGTAELQSMLMKGGHAFAFLKMSNARSVVAGLERILKQDEAKGEIEKELVRKAGQLASINLEKQIDLLAARKGLARIATRFLGLRSLSSFPGPLMLGTLLVDAVILMLDTDYARVLQAIYVITQIWILHTCAAAGCSIRNLKKIVFAIIPDEATAGSLSIQLNAATTAWKQGGAYSCTRKKTEMRCLTYS
ncbi:hypothetical protein AKJ16_DCAP03435 [Drosera capensis]